MSIALLLITIINYAFWVYLIMLFARILSSWIPELQSTKFLQFIAFYTDPYLNIFRRIIPPLGMIDISPIIAFFALGFIEYMLKQLVVIIFT